MPLRCNAILPTGDESRAKNFKTSGSNPVVALGSFLVLLFSEPVGAEDRCVFGCSK